MVNWHLFRLTLNRMENKDATKESFENMIDLLSRSTGDYYFIADFTSSSVCFSANAVEHFGISRENSLSNVFGNITAEESRIIENELQKLRERVSDTASFQFHIETRHGREYTLNTSVKRFSNEGTKDAEMIIGIFQPLTEKESLSPYAGTLSMKDFQRDLGEVFRLGQAGYLLLLDIDNLKAMNFRFGHNYSDDALRILISSMKKATDGSRDVYHILGDCFALILTGYSENDVRQLFFRIQSSSCGRMTVSGGCIALEEYPVPNAQTLLQHAESALYISKLGGKAMLNFFSPQDYAKKLKNIELQEELEDSIRNGFKGFFLVYQAQVRSKTYELFGAEALLRFKSPKRGVVSPDEFIPILEDTGLICQVGLWVLEEALRALRKWRSYSPSFMISVNMSYIQMQDENVGHYVLDILEKSGCDGKSLIMEITESSKCMDYPKMNEIFKLLKSAGITISADDFGTGYSGLDRIKMAAFDEIKIDRSFVRSIGKLNKDYRFLCNMINLASDAGLRVVCEGVELEDELEALEKLEPNLLQGFLFSKPIPADEFEKTYFDSTSDLFDKRIRKDTYLRSRHFQTGKVFSEEDAAKIIQPVIDSVNDIIYISDVDSHELVYLNDAAKNILGADKAFGHKVEEIFTVLNTPHTFMQSETLLRDKVQTGMFKSRTERTYLEKDFLKEISGRRLRVSILLDVTDNYKPNGDVIFKRIEA